MFNTQIHNSCTHYPANNIERYMLYPALAVYSPIENLVRTAVGGAFTLLSIGSLGLSPSINDVANCTRYSRRLVTVPLQIIGNIFACQSTTLTRYNWDMPVIVQSSLIV